MSEIGGGRTYREIVEGGKEEEDADQSDEAEDNAAHWSTPACRGVDFAPTVSAESWKGHEASSDQVCDS